MNNIKGIAIVQDGTAKRMAVTYDVIDDTGTAIKQNAKVNKVLVDQKYIKAAQLLTDYAQTIVDEAEGE